MSKNYILIVILMLVSVFSKADDDFGYTSKPNCKIAKQVVPFGGTFNVGSFGNASYTIPIEVPAGVNGMQPSLSITYDSQAGNGLVGYGCNLDGFSKITRGGKIQAGDIYIDGNRIGNVGNAVMKDRKTMASDGIVVVIANIDRQKNILLGSPNITTRGFVLVNDNIELLKQLEEIVKNIINKKLKTSNSYNELKSEIINELLEYIVNKTGRKPIILPVIMDIKRNDN